MSEDLERLKDRFVKDRDSLIFAQYADLLRKEGHLDEAIEIAERGVMKHPEYATGFLVLGRCYKEKGAPQDAIKQLEIASDLDRQSIIALKELGELHLEQGNKDSAKKVFDKLLALDPLDREVKRMLRRIEEEERAEESGFKEEGLSSYFESKETGEEEVEFEGEPKSSFEDIDIKDLKKVGKAKIGEKEEGGEEIFEPGEKEEAVEEELGEVMEEEGVEGKLEFEAVFGMKEEEEEEERKEEE
ncbi:tetratricopeptide repeat protein, partial [candidate division WOR-3 bacterium]|nr:tetratricopeptide repeat protein [candidate division WOR-3 bacterium]